MAIDFFSIFVIFFGNDWTISFMKNRYFAESVSWKRVWARFIFSIIFFCQMKVWTFSLNVANSKIEKIMKLKNRKRKMFFVAWNLCWCGRKNNNTQILILFNYKTSDNNLIPIFNWKKKKKTIQKEHTHKTQKSFFFLLFLRT